MLLHVCLLQSCARPAMIARNAVPMACDQLNPNNVAYWRARGKQTRPDDWMDVAKRRKAEGQLTVQANAVAAQPRAKKRLMGQMTSVVVEAVKEVLGGRAQVIKAGSQRKGTNTGSSDLDLWIDCPEKMTSDQKHDIAK